MRLESSLDVQYNITVAVFIISSAGVGRTGAFIAIDSLMEQMEAEKVVDVFGFTARMRKQRNYMVQTQVWSQLFQPANSDVLPVVVSLGWREVIGNTSALAGYNSSRLLILGVANGTSKNVGLGKF